MIEEVSNYLNQVRHDFSKAKLDEENVDENPIEQYAKWFEEAVGAQVLDPKAIVISTVSADGQPHSRVVYNRGLKPTGMVFYTNYHSNKGRELEGNQHISILSYWPELERQIRMEGKVEQLPAEESDAYFASRPRESQIGAWASNQSEELTNREVLEEKVKSFTAKFEGQDVPRPPHWGGYLFVPHRVEFWQGRPSRLHDRIVYEKQTDETWTKKRLSP